ncbi:hypothetical protein B0H34DRAFT_799351 [Crassisporium funariophilum]|nr:hypothetical protein B0H34DRAFT_799351 [Crassisporium funariophilum]
MATTTSPVPTIPQVDLIPIYFLVASLTLIIWDILNHLKDDYRLLFKHSVSYPTVIYFVSRITSFGYALGKMIILTALVHPDQCQKFSIANGVIFAVATSSTTLLFYLRVCAVYNQNTWVRVFFGVTWLSVVGGSVTAIPGVVGIPLNPDPTRLTLCIDNIRHLYIMSTSFTLMLNDTLAFAAITYKLGIANLHLRNQKGISGGNVKRMLFGQSLPAFSRALLQDSQIYFLIALSVNVILITTFFTIDSSTPTSPFRLIFVVPTLVLMNIMASRVFRNTRLGRAGLLEPTTNLSSHFEMNNRVAISNQNQRSGDFLSMGSGYGKSRNGYSYESSDARLKVSQLDGEYVRSAVETLPSTTSYGGV